MSIEKPYQPSPEEIKKAEEAMTEKQKVFFETREEISKTIPEVKEFKLEDIWGKTMSGDIKGHKIEIREYYDNDDEKWYIDGENSFVDGIRIFASLAKKIIDKYENFLRIEELANEAYEGKEIVKIFKDLEIDLD